MSIYTVTAGPWEMWCGHLLRPDVLFWKNPPFPWGLESAAWRSSGGDLGDGVVVYLPLLRSLGLPGGPWSHPHPHAWPYAAQGCIRELLSRSFSQARVSPHWRHCLCSNE